MKSIIAVAVVVFLLAFASNVLSPPTQTSFETGAAGDATQFGNSTTTTVWVGGTAGIVNATGALRGKNLTLNDVTCGASEVLFSNGTNGVVCIPAPAGVESDPLWSSNETRVDNLESANVSANARIDNLNSTKLNITDQRYNESARVDDLNTSKLNITDQRYNESARVDDLNSTKLNITDQRYNDSARIDDLNTSKLNVTDQRYNDSARIDDLNTSKLNVTDQRYNDSARIDSLNTSKLNVTDQRYNDTALIDALNTSKLNVTDQRYNDSARIDALNTSKLNITDQRYNESSVIATLNNLSSSYVEGLGNLTNYYNKTSMSSTHTHAGENITSGTISSAYLDANVSLINTSRTWTANQTFQQGAGLLWAANVSSYLFNTTCFIIAGNITSGSQLALVAGGCG